MCAVGCESLRRIGPMICVIAVLTVAAAGQSPSEPSATPQAATNGTDLASPAGPDPIHNHGSTLGQEPAGQEPSGNDQGMFVFKKQVQEVILHATVVDEQRHLVPGLDQSAFSVFENGVPQSVTSFRREDVPVAMGIVVDNSGSMRDKREKVNQAVMSLIRASNPQDEIFVVNFWDPLESTCRHASLSIL